MNYGASQSFANAVFLCADLHNEFLNQTPRSKMPTGKHGFGGQVRELTCDEDPIRIPFSCLIFFFLHHVFCHKISKQICPYIYMYTIT